MRNIHPHWLISNHLKVILCFSLITTLNSGCSMMKKKEAPPTKPIIGKLEQAAVSIQQSMDNLVVEEDAHRSKQKHIPSTGPSELMTSMNIKWVGPIEQFIASLKPVMPGYKIEITGKPPVIPVIVNIKSNDITVYEAIKNAGIQAGVRARVIVDTSNAADKRIEIRYPS